MIPQDNLQVPFLSQFLLRLSWSQLILIFGVYIHPAFPYPHPYINDDVLPIGTHSTSSPVPHAIHVRKLIGRLWLIIWVLFVAANNVVRPGACALEHVCSILMLIYIGYVGAQQAFGTLYAHP